MEADGPDPSEILDHTANATIVVDSTTNIVRTIASVMQMKTKEAPKHFRQHNPDRKMHVSAPGGMNFLPNAPTSTVKL